MYNQDDETSTKIEEMTKDKSVYEYLQIEPANGFHDVNSFTSYLKELYGKRFFNGVSCRSRDLVDNGSIIAQNSVENAGLTDIWPSR